MNSLLVVALYPWDSWTPSLKRDHKVFLKFFWKPWTIVLTLTLENSWKYSLCTYETLWKCDILQEDYQKSSENLNLIFVFWTQFQKVLGTSFKIAKYVHKSFFSRRSLDHLWSFNSKRFLIFQELNLVICAIHSWSRNYSIFKFLISF